MAICLFELFYVLFAQIVLPALINCQPSVHGDLLHEVLVDEVLDLVFGRNFGLFLLKGLVVGAISLPVGALISIGRWLLFRWVVRFDEANQECFQGYQKETAYQVRISKFEGKVAYVHDLKEQDHEVEVGNDLALDHASALELSVVNEREVILVNLALEKEERESKNRNDGLNSAEHKSHS